MRSETTGMNHPFGDTLMVEVEELLAEVKILERGRPAHSDLEGILVVRYRNSLLRSQYRSLAIGNLVRFSAGAHRYILIVVVHTLSVVDRALARAFGRVFLGISFSSFC